MYEGVFARVIKTVCLLAEFSLSATSGLCSMMFKSLSKGDLMKQLRFGAGLLLLTVMSCSSHQYVAYENNETFKPYVSRAIASTTMIDSPDMLSQNISQLTERIFHSYLMGQVLLEKFDAHLEKNPSKALSINEYDQLLAVRIMVDSFEEEINELYLQLVMATALPEFSDLQKVNAQMGLDTIGKFMEGITAPGKELPENLKPMILVNLTEKQTQLYEILKASMNDASITKNSEAAKKAIHSNMVLLRATRRMFNRDLQNYQVDSQVLKSVLTEESSKDSYKDYEKEIKKLSKEIKKYREEFKVGRSTSSDVFFPSTAQSGNITGNGFPANTWSLTYDDGPGGKTTPTVLANLNARGMKATFFVLAQQVEALPTITKNLTASGMDMASHSYTHANLIKLGPQGLEKEIAASKKVIEARTGTTIKLFRLPYGSGVSNANIRSKIAGLNMIHVFWNVDTLDWQDKNPQKIYARTLKQMSGTKNNAGVILFHDIHSQSVTASTMVMDHLKKINAKVCTVQGVVDQINKNLASCN